MPDSTRRNRSDKPTVPEGFPLRAHASGHWCKKIRGHVYYFGGWARRENGKLIRLPNEGNQRAALALYEAQEDDLFAGRIPKARSSDTEGTRIKNLCNEFLNWQRKRMQSKVPELKPCSFKEYAEACEFLIDECDTDRLVDDLGPDDFRSMRAEMGKRWSPGRIAKFICLIRAVLEYGKANGLIQNDVRFGSTFKRPDKAVVQQYNATRDKKLFAAAELRLILDALDGKAVTVKKKNGGPSKLKMNRNPQMKAIVLLAINAGLGNTDIGELQFHNIKDGWLNYPRPKTGMPRRVPLWKETIAALKAHKRRSAKHQKDDECVFLNRAGQRLVQTHTKIQKDGIDVWRQDYVSSQFRELLRKLKINGRKGLGFYAIRHTTTSIGLQVKDRDAVKAIMGHSSHDTLSAYDETGPDDERLIAVVDHVRKWLFGAGSKRRKPR
jgi:integrase